MMVTGEPGVGKTHFATKAPKPLFLDFEEGTHTFDVDRVQIKTLDELREVFKSKEQLSDYKTLVVDSITSVSKLLEEHVLKTFDVKTMSEVTYGKGFTMHAEKLEQVLKNLMGLRMNLIVIAHTKSKTKSHPLWEAFDFLSIHTPKDSENFVCASMDFIGYLHKDAYVKDKKIKGAGNRVITFAPHPAHLAKTRLSALSNTFDVDQTDIFELIEKGE